MPPTIPTQYREAANEWLLDAGFFSQELASFNLPPISLAPNGDRAPVPYAVVGEPDAPNIVLEPTPFATDLRKPSHLLRLLAHQAVLGDDYAVVGVEAYSPFNGEYTHSERGLLRQGDFSPLAERVLRVAQALKMKDYQHVLPYGVSLGGDVAIQTTRDTLCNEHRGIICVDTMGAVEFARISNRGRAAVAGAMRDSSGRFYQNITASGMPALNQAWGLAPDAQPDHPHQGFDLRVGAGSLFYLLQTARNAFPLVDGLGTDRSAHQLKEILQRSSVRVVLGVQKYSTVSSSGLVQQLERFSGGYGLDTFVEYNDHSADDNLRTSAAMALYFASRAKA
jgi:hypothetical protein